MLIGGSREFAGYDITPNVQLAKEIANVTVRILPVLKDTHIIRTFAGLRPYTPDGLPIIGKTGEAEGLYIAAGHEGDGIASAPTTGKIIGGRLLGQLYEDPSLPDGEEEWNGKEIANNLALEAESLGVQIFTNTLVWSVKICEDKGEMMQRENTAQ
ncbi:hypothetical protein GCM10010978_06230 [Compostibacillus humi]|uniref:FAD dependent oxidoreductase domain-containing protein n=1 Tax=Compostibacillus humi TaxID=1245525 RepID=A0A8J2ZR66_9BACI|nr:hypothetical protein GCM10010978_06230 [Compostibacillus humi]